MNKKDQFYFDNLLECIEISEETAQKLLDDLKVYDKEEMESMLITMHTLETKGDTTKHKLTEAISKDFITPLEREDLITLSNLVDDITDCVEEILKAIYVVDVSEIREDVISIIEVLVNCIGTVKSLISEFRNFKKSKNIRELIVLVNDYEEHGDRYYTNSIRELYLTKDLEQILMWKDVYTLIEECFDTCEDVADVILTVIMKNI